jgi:hypothetical protein
MAGFNHRWLKELLLRSTVIAFSCLPALFIPWDGSWHDRTTVPRRSELYQTWPDERLQTQKVHMTQRGAGQHDWQHNDSHFKQNLMKPTMPSHTFDIGYWAVVHSQ